jgi:hypothetical protein
MVIFVLKRRKVVRSAVKCEIFTFNNLGKYLFLAEKIYIICTRHDMITNYLHVCDVCWHFLSLIVLNYSNSLFKSSIAYRNKHTIYNYSKKHVETEKRMNHTSVLFLNVSRLTYMFLKFWRFYFKSINQFQAFPVISTRRQWKVKA